MKHAGLFRCTIKLCARHSVFQFDSHISEEKKIYPIYRGGNLADILQLKKYDFQHFTVE